MVSAVLLHWCLSLVGHPRTTAHIVPDLESSVGTEENRSQQMGHRLVSKKRVDWVDE